MFQIPPYPPLLKWGKKRKESEKVIIFLGLRKGFFPHELASVASQHLSTDSNDPTF